MIESQRFALNRITCPGLSIPELLALARELDMGQVELRNDLGDGRVCDELTNQTGIGFVSDSFGTNSI